MIPTPYRNSRSPLSTACYPQSLQPVSCRSEGYPQGVIHSPEGCPGWEWPW